MKSLTSLAAFSFFVLTGPAVRSQSADHLLKELVKPQPVVADADNGWVEAQKLVLNVPRDEKGRRKDFITYPGDERGEAPGVNVAVLKECQELNKPALAAARRILAMPSWQRPRPEGRWPAALLEPYDQRLGFPVRLILAQAIVEAQKGQLDKGWPDILAVMKLGRRMAESGGPLMETLIGVTVMQNAARTAAWAGQQAPDAATARRLAADLEVLEGYGDIYQRTLEGELYFMVKRAEFFQGGGEEVKRSLVVLHVAMDQLRFSQKSFSEWGDALKGRVFRRGDSIPEWKIPDYPLEENLAHWLKDPPEEVLRQIEAAKQTDWAELSRLAVEQFKKARLIKPVTMAEFRKAERPARDRDAKKESDRKETATFDDTHELVLSVVFRGAATVRQARTSLLLRAWMYDHDGELPGNLPALVPGYLRELPVDPFDGRTMRYQKDKLWSTGGDLKDDGGDDGKDIVLPL